MADPEAIELAMFPLESALLPGEDLPLRIFEPRYTALVTDCLRRDDPQFGVVLISRGREVGGGETRCDVGVLAKITECTSVEGSHRTSNSKHERGQHKRSTKGTRIDDRDT
ncbi:hypothetical protein MHAE_15495 [Mycobacterium haemophilum DSM 44634]